MELIFGNLVAFINQPKLALAGTGRQRGQRFAARSNLRWEVISGQEIGEKLNYFSKINFPGGPIMDAAYFHRGKNGDTFWRGADQAAGNLG